MGSIRRPGVRARKPLTMMIVYCVVLQGAVFALVAGITVATSAPAGAWNDPARCPTSNQAFAPIGGTDSPVPPLDYFPDVTLDSGAPTFSTNENLRQLFGLHWATICWDLRLGLGLDGLDAVQEGLITSGDGQRIPRKPQAAFQVRVPTDIIQACATGTAHSVYVGLTQTHSAVVAHIGLLTLYVNNGTLDPLLADRWMAFALAEKAIIDAKLMVSTLRCR